MMEPIDLMLSPVVLFRIEYDDAHGKLPAMLMRVCKRDSLTNQFVPMSRIFIPLDKVGAFSSMIAQFAAQLEGMG